MTTPAETDFIEIIARAIHPATWQSHDLADNRAAFETQIQSSRKRAREIVEALGEAGFEIKPKPTADDHA